MMFSILSAAVIQAMTPAFRLAGESTLPLLLGIVVYYALHEEGRWVLLAGLTAGIFQDSISLMPLGYTAFCFSAGALVIRSFRDVMVIDAITTHMLLNGLLNGLTTLVLYLLLLNDGTVQVSFTWLLLKLAGAGILGMMAGPLMYRVMLAMNETLGLLQEEA